MPFYMSSKVSQNLSGHKVRLITNKAPTLQCSNSSDRLTTPNGVGLITADEVVYAGGKVGASNSAYYLYVGTQSGSVSGFWTMSPECFNGNNTHVFGVGSNGQLYDVLVDTSVYGVRPVINLSSTVSLVGTGTSADPYRVV